jgi:uncharacterized protein (DUF1499 family)
MKASLAACGIAVLGLLLIAVSGPAFRLGVPLPAAFTILRWGAYLGVAGALVGALIAAYHSWRGTRSAALVAACGLVLGIVVAAIPYRLQAQARAVPPIHDISTDLENPPAFSAIVPLRADAPNSLDRPAAVTDQQRKGYPDLAPVTLSVSPEVAFSRALTVAQGAGWDIVASDQTAGRIEATDTTRWFGFKDDVSIRLTPWGTGTRVDVRSVSRVGRSDIGTNARRIRAFLAAVQR